MPGRPVQTIVAPLPARMPAPAAPLPVILVHVTSGEDRGAGLVQRPQHSHADDWHLVVTTSGRGTFLVGGTVATADAPSLFLIPPGVEHSFNRAPGDDQVYSEVTFRVGATGLGSRPGWRGLLIKRFGSCGPAPTFHKIPDGLAGRLAAAIDDLASAAVDTHPDVAGITQGWIDHLLFLVRLHLLGVSADGPLDRLRAALDEGERLDLTACARLAGLSPQHLCRAFARRFGLPPLRYRRRAALLRGAALLRADDRPLGAIAASAGFVDHRYFIRAFKAAFGLPPATYRRQQRQRLQRGI